MDTGLNRDSALLAEDRDVEWRHMNHTCTMTTEGVGLKCIIFGST